MALTVRDIRVSADGYERVLGFDFVKEFLAAAGDAGIPRFLLLHQHSGFLLGLRSHPGRTGDSFDPLRTGLDHVAFELADRAEFDSWMAHLDHRGVPSPARELSLSVFLVSARRSRGSDRAVTANHSGQCRCASMMTTVSCTDPPIGALLGR
jgi:glyoxylase I family protein